MIGITALTFGVLGARFLKFPHPRPAKKAAPGQGPCWLHVDVGTKPILEPVAGAPLHHNGRVIEGLPKP